MARFLGSLLRLYSWCGSRVDFGAPCVSCGCRRLALGGLSGWLWGLGWFFAGGVRAFLFLFLSGHFLASVPVPAMPGSLVGPIACAAVFVGLVGLVCGFLAPAAGVWERLGEVAVGNLAVWLAWLSLRALPLCAWLLFRVLFTLAVVCVGMPCAMAWAAGEMAVVGAWWVVYFWYSACFLDISCPMVSCRPCFVQFYIVFYRLFFSYRDCGRGALYFGGVCGFVPEFACFFVENGFWLCFCCSLWSVLGWVALLWALLFVFFGPVRLPVMSGIIFGALRWWLALRLFARGGVLTMGSGWLQPSLVAQLRALGRPSWGLRVFLLLALLDCPPFWLAALAPLPFALWRWVVLGYPGGGLVLSRLPGWLLPVWSAVGWGRAARGDFVEAYGAFLFYGRFGFFCFLRYVAVGQAAPAGVVGFVLDGWRLVLGSGATFFLMV
ncbi:hypothetical protein SAMN02745178_00026 [Gemmiger formicilis]|uniref:DUF2264 domain-containing protein n=1 Tax=Gemmiger formicilis TaxID=745368 RepID=A0A1T4W6I0_9FIRM|nr:DUF2264 domain-containing protein [Gemmiger formicilis]SKA72882.1 hypothetical protein SAMN02745178_00026 [Gemmiger formicilis]